MKEMKEQIKIALLAIIAGTLIIQTVMQLGYEQDTYSSTNEESAGIIQGPAAPQSLTAAPTPVEIKSEPEGPKTSIKFAEETFDFGNIKQNSVDNKYVFVFTNTGNIPLIIENAKGSCGCTVPQWPKEPIPPGGTGKIEVDYNPGKQKGSQRKTVTVTANTEPKDTRITISAFVEEVPEDTK